MDIRRVTAVTVWLTAVSACQDVVLSLVSQFIIADIIGSPFHFPVRIRALMEAIPMHGEN